MLAGGGFFAWQHFQAGDDEIVADDNAPAVTENNLSDNTTVVGNYYIVNCQTSVTLRRTPSTMSVELAQVPLGQAVGFIEETNAEFSKVNYAAGLTSCDSRLKMASSTTSACEL